MAYQTGTGTYSQMFDQLATFALANGFSALNTTLAAKQWWRITLCGRLGDDPAIKNLVFRDGAGVDVGVPDTIIFSSQVSQSTAANAFTSTGWYSSQNATTRFVGGFYNSAVNVRQISVEFDEAILDGNSNPVGQDAAPINFGLEWSDDGVTWTTLYVFNTNSVYTQPGGDTFTIDNSKWPLTCTGTGLIYNIATVASEVDTWNDVVDYNPDGTFVDTFPNWYHLNIGTTEVHASRNREDDFIGTPSVYNAMPQDGLVAEWHFFADTTVSNHINCAWRMTHRSQPRWYHLSMGVLDKRGMSHNDVAYALSATHGYYSFSNSTSSDRRWQSLYTGNPMVGAAGAPGTDNLVNASIWYLLDNGGTGYAYPQDGAWPDRDVVHSSGRFRLLPQHVASNSRAGSGQFSMVLDACGGLDAYVIDSEVHPVSGYLSLGPASVFSAAGTVENDLICYMGEVPGWRSCRIDNITDGQEITQDANTWQLFPRIRKSNTAEMNEIELVTSGVGGYAYKKVV